MATDPDLDVEVRVDAAEWLTGDPDPSIRVGEEVLLEVVEDGFVEPLVRAARGRG